MKGGSNVLCFYLQIKVGGESKALITKPLGEAKADFRSSYLPLQLSPGTLFVKGLSAPTHVKVWARREMLGCDGPFNQGRPRWGLVSAQPGFNESRKLPLQSSLRVLLAQFCLPVEVWLKLNEIGLSTPRTCSLIKEAETLSGSFIAIVHAHGKTSFILV